MNDHQYVYSRDGRRGVVVQHADSSSGEQGVARVRFEDGRELLVPFTFLERRPDGAFNLNVGYDELEVAPNTGAHAAERRVLPVVAEQLHVERQQIDTGVVRVRKLVREHEETVDEPTIREEVQVERVPIGQLVETPPQPRNEGNTLVIPVLEEVLVVEKRLMLKEEIRITRRRTEERTPQQFTLRSEEVVVERDQPSATDSSSASSAESH